MGALGSDVKLMSRQYQQPRGSDTLYPADYQELKENVSDRNLLVPLLHNCLAEEN